MKNLNNLLLPINYNYMYQKTVPIFIKINHYTLKHFKIIFFKFTHRHFVIPRR